MKATADSHYLYNQHFYRVVMILPFYRCKNSSTRLFNSRKIWIPPKLVLESQNHAYQYYDQKNDPVF